MPSPAEIRGTAAALLTRIIVRNQTTDQVFGSSEQEPLLMELVFGSLRHYFSLSQSVDGALRHPIRAKDQDIRCLMIVGLYQLHHTRIPAHAAIHETVEAVRSMGKPWAKALVNAVLRNAPVPERSFEHPEWMAQELTTAYGGLAPAIMLANNERAPMALRINLSRVRPIDYHRRLTAAGLGFFAPAADPNGRLTWGPETLILEQPTVAQRLPGFAEGLVAVQDAGALLAIEAIAPVRPASEGVGLPLDGNPKLLDACAAPGGKLFHLLERYPQLEAVALEKSVSRLDALQREARRLGHAGFSALNGDATTLDWWDGNAFDLVLLDAPCSGSGTLRRHPDIKVLRLAGDLPRYVALQTLLLRSVWRTLKPGGTLLYCTCSLFPAENDDVIGKFLEGHANAKSTHLQFSTGHSTRYGWQLLPTDSRTDGFYFSRIEKAPE